MRLHIERDRCVASGQCVMLAPEVFDQDEDGVATTLVDDADETTPGVADAVRICPAAAIKLLD
jgi:ferredoxin